jgi:hypothetical protein
VDHREHRDLQEQVVQDLLLFRRRQTIMY